MSRSAAHAGFFKPFEFNYASFRLEPFAKDDSYSGKLLKEIIEELIKLPMDKRTIDVFKTRKGAKKRLLAHIGANMMSGTRCFGRIALIKDKAPFIWSGNSEILEEVKKDSNKEFVEITNYMINFSATGDPVIMFEYNHSGPRLNDILLFLRYVSKEYRISRSITYSIHLSIEFSDLSKILDNVLDLNIKVKSSNIVTSTDRSWFHVFKNLESDTGFRDLKLKLFFKRMKDKRDGKFVKNIRGTRFAREILDWLGKDKWNSTELKDFKMSYQVADDENIIELDFLKNKTISGLNIPVNDSGIFKASEFREIVGLEFSSYLSTGKTRIDELPIK
jgi:hypothetical protein